MTPTQRAAAERLIKARNVLFTHKAVVEWADHAEALLRELLAEPLHESKPTTASQFESVKQAKRAAEYELRYYTKMMKEKNAAPQQRKPLTREQIDTVWSSLGSFTDRESDYRIFARAIERAHGITGEQK